MNKREKILNYVTIDLIEQFIEEMDKLSVEMNGVMLNPTMPSEDKIVNTWNLWEKYGIASETELDLFNAVSSVGG